MKAIMIIMSILIMASSFLIFKCPGVKYPIINYLIFLIIFLSGCGIFIICLISKKTNNHKVASD